MTPEGPNQQEFGCVSRLAIILFFTVIGIGAGMYANTLPEVMAAQETASQAMHATLPIALPALHLASQGFLPALMGLSAAIGGNWLAARQLRNR